MLRNTSLSIVSPNVPPAMAVGCKLANAKRPVKSAMDLAHRLSAWVVSTCKRPVNLAVAQAQAFRQALVAGRAIVWVKYESAKRYKSMYRQASIRTRVSAYQERVMHPSRDKAFLVTCLST